MSEVTEVYVLTAYIGDFVYGSTHVVAIATTKDLAIKAAHEHFEDYWSRETNLVHYKPDKLEFIEDPEDDVISAGLHTGDEGDYFIHKMPLIKE